MDSILLGGSDKDTVPLEKRCAKTKLTEEIKAKKIAPRENSQSFVVNIFKKTPLYPRLSNQSQSV